MQTKAQCSLPGFCRVLYFSGSFSFYLQYPGHIAHLHRWILRLYPPQDEGRQSVPAMPRGKA